MLAQVADDFLPEPMSHGPEPGHIVMDITLLSVLVAAVVAFIASAGWYAALGDAMVRHQRAWRGAEPAEAPRASQMLVFLGVAVAVSLAVAVVLDLAGVDEWLAGAGWGLRLWAGFVLTQWVSATAGEDVPVPLAAIHAGDWLVRLVAAGAIIGAWP